MDALFDIENSSDFTPPLADRMRPKSIDEVFGQDHLIGKNAPLRKFFEKRDFRSMIFWGPPGVGKTTFAYLMADAADHNFTRISAVEAGVKEVREIIKIAEKLKRTGKKSLLFIDEIHRFNKSQQDALLHAVERGIITLVGATTENPSFEVNAALLSRTQVYRLQPLSDEDIKQLIDFALKNDIILKEKLIEIQDIDFLVQICGGDARTALNALELSIQLAEDGENEKTVVTPELIQQALQRKTAQYDKKGDSHYDTISAFIKSMRGSDPDAAIFWLAKMLDAGEDPKFIARRMVIFASEDIGNSDPMALNLAVSVFRAVEIIGMPEARINLAQGVTYLASTTKSNASYMAINKAMSDIESGIDKTVPLHLRNAPTKLMKEEGYGKEYKYPHNFSGNFTHQSYFPESLSAKVYYEPSNNGREAKIKERLRRLWSSSED